MQRSSLARLGLKAQALAAAMTLVASFLGGPVNARPPAQNSLDGLGAQSPEAKIELLRLVHGRGSEGAAWAIEDRFVASFLTMFGGGAGAGLDAVRRAQPSEDQRK